MSRLANSSPGMGLFKGAHNFLLNNPTIVANYANQNEAHAIQLLGKYSLPGAEFDSSERDPPPRCPPSAHLNMLADLQLWAHNPLRATSIQWVRGPAGVGKTAIMQTFSELEAASEASILGATLFFSRANRRNDPQRVFTTIAYQLAIKYPSYRKHVVEIILHDPRVVQKSMAEQFKRFILQPVVVQKLFEGVHETILIILDGLDKCKGERRQQEIVSLIRQMTTQHPTSPLIWLIASRPEPHIRAIFGQSNASLNQEPPPSIKSDQRSKDVERDPPCKLQPNREPDPTPVLPSVNRRESSVPPLAPPLPPTPIPLTNFPTSSQTKERRLSSSVFSETPSWHPRGRRTIRPIPKNELEKNEEEAGAELIGKPREKSRSLMTSLSQSERTSSPEFESHRSRSRDREPVPPILRAAESSHGSRSPQSLSDDDYDSDVSSEPSDSIAHSNDSKLTLSRSINTMGRLANLRTEMEKAGVDYYIVPSEDAHGSECVAACDKRLEYITGFTGPKGDAVITRDSAYLVTGPRYWPQAESQTDRNWTIIKAGVDHDFPQKMYKDWVEFFLTLLSKGQRIGIDARMISHEKAVLIDSKLESLDCKFVFPRQNLVDLVWRNKPGKPRGVVYVQGIEYTGRDTRYKLCKLREWIQAQPPSILSHSKNTQPTAQQMHVGMLVNSLACIAWTLNLRGLDILFNPLFRAYLFIGLNKTILFLDSSKIDEAVTNYLEKMNVERRNYTDLWSFLRQNEWGEGKLLVPPSTSYAITLALTHSRFTLAPNRVEYMMALKNDTELEGLRKAYIRDGVAFVRFLAWLEYKLNSGYEVTEWEAAWRLKEFQMKQKGFMGLAYETISASGPNIAIPHFEPNEYIARVIDPDAPYLVDFGGQYRVGTCTTSRSFHFGKPTPDQGKVYTRLLQAHISLHNANFPDGTFGYQLDGLKKMTLGRNGTNYSHDIRHGPGSFLTVREGSLSFSSSVPLTPGHVITSDLAFQLMDEWGIGLKSTLVAKHVQTTRESESKVWLGFERLTCVPIQTRMVNKSMLTREEISWLRKHNKECLRVLGPYLTDDKRALKWLKREAGKGIGIGWLGAL